MFPSVIVKGDPRSSEGTCVMLDVGLFCPHCSRAMSGKLSSTLRRVPLTKSASAENLHKAKVQYGTPGAVHPSMLYGSLDRASLRNKRQGIMEERGFAFTVGHSDSDSAEELCQHGAIPRPIPVLPPQVERLTSGGARSSDKHVITTVTSAQTATTCPSLAHTSHVTPVMTSDMGNTDGYEQRSDYDSLESSALPSLDTSMQSVDYRKNSSSDYDSMDTHVTRARHIPPTTTLSQRVVTKQTYTTSQTRTTKHESLERLGHSASHCGGPVKRHSDDVTMLADSKAKISRISPESEDTRLSASVKRVSSFGKRRQGSKETYVSDSEQIEVSDPREEALIEELLHDEEVTDDSSMYYISSSGDELERYDEEEFERMEKVVSASLEEVAKTRTEDFQFDEHLAYVPSNKTRPKSQESVDLYHRNATAILENTDSVDEVESCRSLSPDVEDILDNLDTETYSGDVTLPRIFSVRRDMQVSPIHRLPPLLQESDQAIDEITVEQTQPQELKDLQMSQTLETPEVPTSHDSGVRSEKESEQGSVSKLEITQDSVFFMDNNNSLPKRQRDWSPEDYFEQVVESLPHDSEEGLNDWTSDCETDEFDRDKIRTDFNIKGESDQEETKITTTSSYPQYLIPKHVHSRTSSCEAILDDSHHEIESSMGGTSYHDTGSEHSGDMSGDYLSSSECSVGENAVNAVEREEHFKNIIADTITMTQNLKSIEHLDEPQIGGGSVPRVVGKRDAYLVQAEDEEHLREEIKQIRQERLEEQGAAFIKSSQKQSEFLVTNTTETTTTSKTQVKHNENGSVHPPRPPVKHKPTMYAKINKIPLVSHSGDEAGTDDDLNVSCSSSDAEVYPDLDLEYEFENNMRLCEEDARARGITIPDSVDDVLLHELLSDEPPQKRVRKDSTEVEDYVAETSEPDAQPEVIQQAYEAAQYVAKLLDGHQMHHPCAHGDEDAQEAISEPQPVSSIHEHLYSQALVSESDTEMSDFEKRDSLSRQEARDFMKMMLAASKPAENGHIKEEDEADGKAVTVTKGDEDYEVKSEEVTTQEVTLVIAWPKKLGTMFHPGPNPLREIHLHRVTKLSDLDVQVIEGPTINSVEYPISEETDPNQKANVKRIATEMAVVRSQVANEIPMVYKTNTDDGSHSARSATHSEQTAIATATGEVISIEKSQKFTHITTTYDVKGGKEKATGGATVSEISADSSKVQRPLSSVQESEPEAGEHSISMVHTSRGSVSVEDETDGTAKAERPPDGDSGDKADSLPSDSGDNADDEDEDLSDDALYSIVRDLKALISSQREQTDVFEGYAPPEERPPTPPTRDQSSSASVITHSTHVETQDSYFYPEVTVINATSPTDNVEQELQEETKHFIEFESPEAGNTPIEEGFYEVRETQEMNMKERCQENLENTLVNECPKVPVNEACSEALNIQTDVVTNVCETTSSELSRTTTATVEILRREEPEMPQAEPEVESCEQDEVLTETTTVTAESKKLVTPAFCEQYERDEGNGGRGVEEDKPDVQEVIGSSKIMYSSGKTIFLTDNTVTVPDVTPTTIDPTQDIQSSAVRVEVLSPSYIPEREEVDVVTHDVLVEDVMNNYTEVTHDTQICSPDFSELSNISDSRTETTTNTTVYTDSTQGAKILVSPEPHLFDSCTGSPIQVVMRNKVFDESRSPYRLSDISLLSDDYDYTKMGLEPEVTIDDYNTTDSDEDIIEEQVAQVLYDMVTTVCDFETMTKQLIATRIATPTEVPEQQIVEQSIESEQATEQLSSVSLLPPTVTSIETRTETSEQTVVLERTITTSTTLTDEQSTKEGSVERETIHHIIPTNEGTSSGPEEPLTPKSKHIMFHEADPSNRLGSPMVGADKDTAQGEIAISAEEIRECGTENEMAQLTKEIREKIRSLLSTESEEADESTSDDKKVAFVDVGTGTQSAEHSPLKKEVGMESTFESMTTETEQIDILRQAGSIPFHSITPMDEIRIEVEGYQSPSDIDPVLSPVYYPGVKDHSAFIEEQMRSPTMDEFSQQYEDDISTLEHIEWSEDSGPIVDKHAVGKAFMQHDQGMEHGSSSSTQTTQLASTYSTTVDQKSTTNTQVKTTWTLGSRELDIGGTREGREDTLSPHQDSSTVVKAHSVSPTPINKERSIYEINVRKYFGLPDIKKDAAAVVGDRRKNRARSHEEIRNVINGQYLTGSQETITVNKESLVSAHSTSSLTTKSYTKPRHLRLPKIRTMLVDELSKDEEKENRNPAAMESDDLFGWLVRDKCMSLEEEIKKRLKEILQMVDKYEQEGTIPRKERRSAREKLEAFKSSIASKSSEMEQLSLECKMEEKISVCKLLQSDSDASRSSSSKSLSPDVKKYVENMTVSIMQRVMTSVEPSKANNINTKDESPSLTTAESCEKRSIDKELLRQITDEWNKSDLLTPEPSIVAVRRTSPVKEDFVRSTECHTAPKGDSPPPLPPPPGKYVPNTPTESIIGPMSDESIREFTVDEAVATRIITADEETRPLIDPSDSSEDEELSYDTEIETQELFTKMEIKDNYAQGLETILECDEDLMSSCSSYSTQSSTMGSLDNISVDFKSEMAAFDDLIQPAIQEHPDEILEDEEERLMSVEKITHEQFASIQSPPIRSPDDIVVTGDQQQEAAVVVCQMGGGEETTCDYYEETEAISIQHSPTVATSEESNRVTTQTVSVIDIKEEVRECIFREGFMPADKSPTPEDPIVFTSDCAHSSRENSIDKIVLRKKAACVTPTASVTTTILTGEPSCEQDMHFVTEGEMPQVDFDLTDEAKRLSTASDISMHSTASSSSTSSGRPVFFVSLAVTTLMEDLLDKIDEGLESATVQSDEVIDFPDNVIVTTSETKIAPADDIIPPPEMQNENVTDPFSMDSDSGLQTDDTYCDTTYSESISTELETASCHSSLDSPDRTHSMETSMDSTGQTSVVNQQTEEKVSDFVKDIFQKVMYDSRMGLYDRPTSKDTDVTATDNDDLTTGFIQPDVELEYELVQGGESLSPVEPTEDGASVTQATDVSDKDVNKHVIEHISPDVSHYEAIASHIVSTAISSAIESFQDSSISQETVETPLSPPVITLTTSEDTQETIVAECVTSPVYKQRRYRSQDSLSQIKRKQREMKSRSWGDDGQTEVTKSLKTRFTVKSSSESVQSQLSEIDSVGGSCDMTSGSETDSTLKASESDFARYGMYSSSSSTLKASDSDLSGVAMQRSVESIGAFSQEDVVMYEHIPSPYHPDDQSGPQDFVEDSSSETDSSESSTSSSSSSSSGNESVDTLQAQCDSDSPNNNHALTGPMTDTQPFWDTVFGTRAPIPTVSSTDTSESDYNGSGKGIVLSNQGILALAASRSKECLLPEGDESPSTQEDSMHEDENEERGREALSYEEILPNILSQEELIQQEREVTSMYFAPIRDDRSDDSDISAHAMPVLWAEGAHVEARYEALPYLKETALLDDHIDDDKSPEKQVKGKKSKSKESTHGSGSSSESDTDIEKLKPFLESFSCQIEPARHRPRSCPPPSLSPNLDPTPLPDYPSLLSTTPGEATLDSLVCGQSAMHDKLSRVKSDFDKLLEEIRNVKAQFKAIQDQKSRRRWSANLEELCSLRRKAIELQEDVQHVSHRIDFTLTCDSKHGGSAEDFSTHLRRSSLKREGDRSRSRSTSGERRVRFKDEQVERRPADLGGDNSAFHAFRRSESDLDKYDLMFLGGARKRSRSSSDERSRRYSDLDLLHGDVTGDSDLESRTSRSRSRKAKDAGGDEGEAEHSDDEGYVREYYDPSRMKKKFSRSRSLGEDSAPVRARRYRSRFYRKHLDFSF